MAKKDKKNPIAATQLPPTQLGRKEDLPREKKGFDPQKYLGRAAQVAKSTVYVGNKRFKNAAKHFPADPLMRTCDKFFPFAEGGELYIDEPRDEQEVKNCQIKAEKIQQEGERYCYLDPGKDLVDAFNQLKGRD